MDGFAVAKVSRLRTKERAKQTPNIERRTPNAELEGSFPSK